MTSSTRAEDAAPRVVRSSWRNNSRVPRPRKPRPLCSPGCVMPSPNCPSQTLLKDTPRSKARPVFIVSVVSKAPVGPPSLEVSEPIVEKVPMPVLLLLSDPPVFVLPRLPFPSLAPIITPLTMPLNLRLALKGVSVLSRTVDFVSVDGRGSSRFS